MGGRWRLFRRRTAGFWAFFILVICYPLGQTLGTLIFQIANWVQYRVWIDIQTYYAWDGNLIHKPDRAWIAVHPFLHLVLALPLAVTFGLLTMVIVLVFWSVDEALTGGARQR